jgi:putative endopeptidase
MKALDLRWRDRRVDLGQDFYHHAYGKWLKKKFIPPDKPAWNYFVEQGEKNYRILNILLRKSRGKLRQFYRTALSGRSGLAALRRELNRIEAITSPRALAEVLAQLHLRSCDPFFGFGAMTDPDNSRRKIADLVQGGLSLPDREYYLEVSSAPLRKSFLTYTAGLFRLCGVEEGATAAATVLRIETALARQTMSKVALRDPHNTTHKMTLRRLKKLAPAFAWDSYFMTLGAPRFQTLNVSQPDFFRAFDRLLQRSALADLKTYLRWQLINSAAPYLSEAGYDAFFAFYKRQLLGLKQKSPRWKRVVDSVNGLLGDELGKLYIRRHFSVRAKRKMTLLVNNLIVALGQRIKRLDWMGPKTKKEALKKLRRITIKIGYPAKWENYGRLEVRADSYLANVWRARKFHVRKDLREIGKPVDKQKWLLPPQIVNAYYNPPNNEIVFPAGILQPPMFDPDADDAVNYGAVGHVIAHELTHGFDDQGRKYDHQGNLRDWWTKGDDRRFRQRTRPLVRQFAGYTVLGNKHLNGHLTLGENIADLGGLLVGFTALQNSLKHHAPGLIDSLTQSERFFFGHAQVWKTRQRPEYQALLLKIDPHSPPQYRVNGAIANMPEFRFAFGLQPDKRSKVVKIW